MRLKRSDPNGPGLRRIRRGKGFSYLGSDGRTVHRADEERIRRLAIPPAWRQVWICPFPNGHIQAVGTDAAGRRQYLYHPRWQQERSEEKFDRVLQMAPSLPGARARIAEDLDAPGLHRDRVVALGLHLLDRGYFRAGGEAYANKEAANKEASNNEASNSEAGENNSYGIATLLCEHIRMRNGSVLFDYPAKHGIQRSWQVDDPAVVCAVRQLLRENPGGRLLVYRSESGWTELHAEDLNARFKDLVGEDHSVKDMRTWHGTVLAAAAFVDADPPVNQTVRKRVQAAIMREVSEELGNTPAVVRSSYVDPRVVYAYENGITIAASARRAARTADRDAAQAILEKGTATMIRRIARTSVPRR